MPTFYLQEQDKTFYIKHGFSGGEIDYRVNSSGLNFIQEFGLRPDTDIGSTCFYYMHHHGHISLLSSKSKSESNGPANELPPIKVNLMTFGVCSFLLLLLVFTVANN